MNKKGSLELSVNAIVVLILAITMLGLGLGFMKGMFGKVSQNVDTAIGQNQLTNPPSATNPFTISSNQITLSRGQSQTITLAYFNEGTASVIVAPNISSTCLSSSDVSITPGALPLRTVSVGDIASWQVLVAAKGAATTGNTQPCSFNITGNRYADLFINIK